MSLDPEFLSAQAQRVTAVFRPPRRSLSTVQVEFAILLDGLCTSETQAEQIVTALIALPFPRSFDYASIAAAARKLAAAPKIHTPAELFSQALPAAELDGLLAYGRGRPHLKQYAAAQDFNALWDAAVKESDQWADSEEAQPFHEYFSRWWIERYSRLYPKTCREPFLARNARNRVSIAYYNRLILGEPLPEIDPAKPAVRPQAAAAAAGQFEAFNLHSEIEALAAQKSKAFQHHRKIPVPDPKGSIDPDRT